MRKSDQLAETVARLGERDESFDPLERTASEDCDGRLVFPLSALAEILGHKTTDSKFEKAVNRAKITIRKSGKRIDEHFLSGTLFKGSSESYVTVYAAFLVIVNADPEQDLVARAQDYFVSKADPEIQEQEKRLKNRFDVVEENKRLARTAKGAGVDNFAKFNAEGYRGLYGGRNLADVAAMKGLKRGSDVLDFSGSEELAAHLFRITQTNAALKRDHVKSEDRACVTHRRVGKEVRNAIRKMGGTMPEQLPAADVRIDTVTSQTIKRLRKLDTDDGNA